MNSILPPEIQQLLQQIPSVTELLKTEAALDWLKAYPLGVVTTCFRRAAAEFRQELQKGDRSRIANGSILDTLIAAAGRLLEEATLPHVRGAVNATGIILHTGLGRAVNSGPVIDSLLADLKAYTVLAVDRETGERMERDELIEYIVTELTGAEAATVVNNNAAATMLVLAGLAAHKEVVVSRGQLIEIGGSFRLPEVMQQSQARLVEVGATNRTHLKDYRGAIGPETAALMRVHPSNYRVIGFTQEVSLREMAELAHSRSLLVIDDLGAGALLDLAQFGLPHEPTVRESIEAGADIVLFSGDKLIGAGQAGVIVGKKALIDRLRKHPLMRAMRVDKTCLMLLERTLYLFRDVERLRREHPIYRMICSPVETLRARAQRLVEALAHTAPSVVTTVHDSVAYLGSGSLPTEAIPSIAVAASTPARSSSQLARGLRLDPECIFGRIEDNLVRLDMRTITDAQVSQIAAAFGRICS